MNKLGLKTTRDLAEKCKFKDHKKIFNFLEGISELNFYDMIKICQFLFSNQAYEVLNIYALEVKRIANKKVALEYCSTNRQLTIGYKLLESLDDEAWIEVYTLLFGRVEEIKTPEGEIEVKIKPEEILSKIKELKVKSEELKVLVQILQSYAYQDLEKYALCYESFNGIETDLKKVTNMYFKHALQIRHTELAGYLCLKVFGDISTSRKYCKELIKNNLIEIGYKATAYYILGTSYMFEDICKCITYLNLSIDAYKLSARAGSEIYIENYIIPLAYTFHNQFNKVKTTDKSLLAYLHTKLNKDMEAMEYLDDFLNENEESPFTLFVRGLILKDLDLLADSLARYDEKGEMFYINLPRLTLLKLGEPKRYVNGMIKHKVKSFEGMDEFEKNNFRNVSSLNDFRYKRQFG